MKTLKNNSKQVIGWVTTCSTCLKEVTFTKVGSLSGKPDEATKAPRPEALCSSCYLKEVATYRTKKHSAA